MKGKEKQKAKIKEGMNILRGLETWQAHAPYDIRAGHVDICLAEQRPAYGLPPSGPHIRHLFLLAAKREKGSFRLDKIRLD